MKVVLFEGPDKTGKSSKVNDLLHRISLGEDEDFGSKYEAIKLNVPYELPTTMSAKLTTQVRTERLRMTAFMLYNIAQTMPDNVICLVDRLHLSEYVYGECLRAGDYDATLVKGIDTVLVDYLDTILVTCVPAITDEQIKLYGMNGLIDDLTYDQYRHSVDLFVKAHADSGIKKKMLVTFDDLIDPIFNKWLVDMLEA